MRWIQRLDNFGTAVARLDKASAKGSYTDLERAGLVLTFAVTYELSWKTLKELLCFLGYTVNSPRGAIRQAFEVGYLNEEDCEAFLRMLDNRKRLSHIYSEDEARYAENLIKGEFLDVLHRLHNTLERVRSQ